MDEIEVPGVVVAIGFLFLGVVYLRLFNRYVGWSAPLFGLSVAVGWLFLLPSRLFLEFSDVLEAGRWVVMILAAVMSFIAVVRLGSGIGVRLALIPLLILSFLFATALWSVDPSLTLERAGAVMVLAAAVMSTLWYVGDSLPDMERAMKAIVMPVIVLFWALALVYGFDMSFYEKGLWRTPGPMLNPNSIATISALLAPVAHYLWREGGRGRRLWSVALFTFLGMIVLSGSRTGLLAVIAGMGFVMAARTRSPSAVVLLLPCLGFVGYVLWEMTGFQDALGTYLRVEFLSTGSGRLEAWAAGIQLLGDRIWFGYGFGTEDLLFRLFDFVFEIHQGDYVHNSYLGLALQIGIVAAPLVFLWMLAISVKGFRAGLAHRDRITIALEATVISGLALAVGESWFYSAGNAYSLPFWLLFGILVQRTRSLRSIDQPYPAR
jgi:O-antigen ligase